MEANTQNQQQMKRTEKRKSVTEKYIWEGKAKAERECFKRRKESDYYWQSLIGYLWANASEKRNEKEDRMKDQEKGREKENPGESVTKADRKATLSHSHTLQSYKAPALSFSQPRRIEQGEKVGSFNS